MTVTATAKDGAGQVIDRPVTWTSSDTTKVRVSAGIITGMAPGVASVQATADSRTATTQVTVKDGGVAGPQASTVAAASGAVLLVVPAGALSQAANIFVAPAASLTTDPHLVAGTAFDFGPTGLTFAQPTSLTLKYDPAKLPSGAQESSLRIYLDSAGAWRQLGASVVNTVAKTVTTPVLHFSTYAVLAVLPVATVSVTPQSATLLAGNTLQLIATTTDASGQAVTGRLVSWSTSDPTIATVSGAGVVTAIGTGSATITATSEGKSGSAQVTVVAPPPVPVASVAVTPGSASLTVGGTTSLTAVARDASGNVLTGRAVSWTSSAPGDATVSPTGVVTAIAAGSATITATSEGKSGSAQIKINAPVPKPVAMVSVTPPTATVSLGGTVQLSAITRDTAGDTLTGRLVSWSSGAPSIATVSASGVVTGLSTGTAVVTATSEGKSAAAQITVSSVDNSPPTLQGFSYTPDSVDVSAGSATITVTLSVKDIGTGVQGVQVRMFSPTNKQITDGAYTPVTGTANNGTYVVRLTIPRSFDSGTFSITSVEIWDNASNSHIYYESDLRAAGYPAKVKVTASGADNTAPTLQSFSFAPDSVGVSTGSATITVTLGLADLGTGVQYVQVRMFSPTGKQITNGAGAPVSGTANSGTYVVPLTIPQNFDSGIFSITSVELIDNAANFRSYNESQLQAAGYSTKVKVTP